MKREILLRLEKELNEDIGEKDIFVRILSEGTEPDKERVIKGEENKKVMCGEIIKIFLFKRMGKLLRLREADLFLANNVDRTKKTFEMVKKIMSTLIENEKKLLMEEKNV